MSPHDESDAPFHRTESGRLLLTLAAISLLALVARLFALGTRVAHWDEGRVGYWTLRYMETGEWSYRPIIHGPFLQQVNPFVFDVLGATDFTMRLVVAVIGALLPLSAWLFRERLRDSEMVALALLFAANPVLLYFSRFMRSDVPLAAFMIFALGFYVRTLDTRDTDYLYLGTAMLALAFTTKENVLVYLMTWAGATVLLFDHRLFRARDRDEYWVTTAKRGIRETARGVWSWRLPLVIALAEFFAIVVLFYAPRPDLWQAFSDPAMFPDVIHEATVGSWNEFTGQWVGGAMERDHGYFYYATDLWETMLYAAAPLLGLSVVGFVADRYAPEGPRDLVAFAAYWGYVMILGYPLVTDIRAPHGPVHAVVPLAFPAAVGLALLYRWGRDSLADDDRLGVALTLAVFVVLAAVAGSTAVTSSYVDPVSQENQLVQYVQPPQELRPTLETIERISAEHDDGADVLFYGRKYAPDWHDRLPLPWYLERYDAELAEAETESELDGDLPPVVITNGESNSDARADREEIESHLDDYERVDRGMAYHTKKITVYIDRDYLRS